MKTLCNIAVLILLLVVSGRCFAMISIADVSRGRANELGVAIRSEKAGTNQVNVWIEFKKQGALKNFSHAELSILDGERLVLSTTMVTRPGPTPDSVLLYFSADHATLPACMVTMVTDMDIGYRFKMKDFIEQEKSAVTDTNDSTNRPFLAIWEDSEGLHRDSEAPYLRIAIWNDGRIIFARDAGKWDHELLEGRIEAARVEELKKAVEQTGVFGLKGNCYLVPDAPVDCVMLDFGAKQQMLYWDERESPGYGINISPKEQHLKFMSCWKEVNRLALEAVPKNSQPHSEKFQRPPQSWRLKRPIQSE